MMASNGKYKINKQKRIKFKINIENQQTIVFQKHLLLLAKVHAVLQDILPGIYITCFMVLFKCFKVFYFKKQRSG